MPLKSFLPLFLIIAFPAGAMGAEFGTFLSELQSQIHDQRAFSPESCAVVLTGASDRLEQWNPSSLDLAQGAKQGAAWVQSLFHIRLDLQARLREFELHGPGARPACVSAVRRTLRMARYAEDYLILWVLPAAPYAAPTLQGPAPQLLTANGGPVRLRSGDVLMSRGNAFVSAAIARIGSEESQFSHATEVYIDAPPGTEVTLEQAATDPRVHTIEAHIEVGSFTRPFGDYIADGNARVVQLRPDLSSAEAHRGAKGIFDYVHDYQAAQMRAAGRNVPDVNDNPPYDFQMDLANHDSIFCAEIVSMAAGFAGLNLPTFPSVLKQNDLTRRLGITARDSFAPGDLDVDPHFEMLAEWRNIPMLAATLKKDVAFNAVYGWMSDENYSFHPNTGDLAKANGAWMMRHLDLGLKDKLPKNMSTDTIALDFLIDRVGAVLQSRVESFEADYRAAHGGRPPFFPQERSDLERFRLEDREPYLHGEYSQFHQDLH